MVCIKCVDMLYYHEGRIKTGPALALTFTHHCDGEALQDSADEGCYLCRTLSSKIEELKVNVLQHTGSRDTEVRFLTATLKCVRPGQPQVPQLHQLEFRLEGVTEVVGSFVLEEIINRVNDPHQESKEPQTNRKAPEDQEPIQPAQSASTSSPHIRGSETLEHGIDPDGQTIEHFPRSTSTKSPDVLNLAKRWIEECADEESGHTKCRPIPGIPQMRYPTRLLDLRDMIEYKQKEQKRHKEPYIPPKLRRSDTYHEDLAEKRLQEAKDLIMEKSAQKVYLVSQREGAGEQRSGKQEIGGRYVTLSHCWGKADFIKLTARNIEKWQDGMPVVKLPQTFQDAIEFACQLENVRYIWIDALCIIQGDEMDWLAQSAVMHEVYMYSYCNISATAATDSTKGLFFGRNPSTLWYDEVSIKLEDDLRGNKGRHIRCKIFDLSFWEEIVDKAPVNKRAWVFQERLLAPRVIHWCKDQIAFECREIDRAECLPSGLPHYQQKGSSVIEEPKVKCIDIQIGKKLRELRLEDEGESAALTIQNQSLYLYEIWKRWVETYSKMDISYHRDRLIAMSGIAAMMTSILKEYGSEDEYIAGMWRKHIASQLLWHVNEGNEPSRQPFENTRPKDHKVSTKEIYRAPSFSWASVETSRGVSFPETTDEEMLITVDVVRLTHVKGSDDSGLLTDGYVVIRGFLRKIELIDTEASRKILTLSQWWQRQISAASGASSLPLFISLAIGAIFRLQKPFAAITSWTARWGVLNLILAIIYFVFRREDAMRKPQRLQEHKGQNRYKWCLLKGGKRGKIMEELWLDSPASPPSIFDRRHHVYCVPAARRSEELICLLLQSTPDGDYGVRYKRIGLAKVLTMFGDDADILKPPGLGDITLGKYYRDSAGQRPGETTICII